MMDYDGESAAVGAVCSAAVMLMLAAFWGRSERQRDRVALRDELMSQVRILQRESAPVAQAISGGRYQVQWSERGGPMYLFDTHRGWIFASTTAADGRSGWDSVVAPPWISLDNILVAATNRDSRSREILAVMRAECSYKPVPEITGKLSAIPEDAQDVDY